MDFFFLESFLFSGGQLQIIRKSSLTYSYLLHCTRIKMWILHYLKRMTERKLCPLIGRTLIYSLRDSRWKVAFPRILLELRTRDWENWAPVHLSGISMVTESGKFQWKKTVINKSIHRQGNDDGWAFSKSAFLRRCFWEALPRLWWHASWDMHQNLHLWEKLIDLSGVYISEPSFPRLGCTELITMHICA